ncbi:MAG: hypothetical protein RL414_1009 [Actinomycetota bacterium]|jgi:hypothetical protein
MARDLNSPLSGRVTSRFGGSGKYRNKIVVGIGIAAVVPFLLSTFAASVTVGSGQLAFGQGSQQAIACDSQVYVALNQEWHSAPQATDSSAGFFRVRSVTISNIDLVACKNTKLRMRLIDMTGHEIALGSIPSATVLQVALPNTDAPVSTSDPAVMQLAYLTGTGDPISGVMASQISLTTSGVSVYDGSTLSPNSSDVTFYIDPSQQVNIDGQSVGRVTVETVNNPKANA